MPRPKIYTTLLSPDQVKTILLDLMSIKGKFLFYSWKEYPGSLAGANFHISNLIFDYTNLTRPNVQGKIRPMPVGQKIETIVELKSGIPFFTLIFYGLFPTFMIPIMILTDEMTINGVLREPTVLERIGFSLLSFGVPGVIFYFTTLLPISRMKNTLVDKLKLSEARGVE
jgi:hypothetical protein